MRIVRRADGFPMFGPVCLEGLLQPARVGHANHRIVFQFGQQCFTFALGAAQHGIEQPLGPGLLQLVHAADGFADGGMGRNTGMQQLIEADQQQCFDITVGGLERLLQQFVGQPRQARLPARGTKGQFLGQTAITGVHLAEDLRQAATQRRLARQHDAQRTGRRQTRIHWPRTRPGANCSRRLLYRSPKPSGLPPGSCRRARHRAPLPQATVSPSRMRPGSP